MEELGLNPDNARDQHANEDSCPYFPQSFTFDSSGRESFFILYGERYHLPLFHGVHSST